MVEHYIYSCLRKKSDRNGNPKKFVSVWRIIRGKPVLLKHNAEVGYHDYWRVALEIIGHYKGWDNEKKYPIKHHVNGYHKTYAQQMLEKGKFTLEEISR